MNIHKIHHLRKLIVSANLSLDGFFAGPDDEMDWHFRSWTPDMSLLLREQLSSADTIVLGRITYLKMASYWQKVVLDVHFPLEDYPLAELINRCNKIVFSKTPELPEWKNSRVINTLAEKELMKMKDQQGKDMIVLGSGLLAHSLLLAGIVDELILWIHPVVLKKGRLLFTTMPGDFLLILKRKVQTDAGVMVLFYEVSQKAA